MVAKDSRVTTNYNTLANSSAENISKEKWTIEEILTYIGFGCVHVKLLVLIGIAWVADGMELMVLSILGPILSYEWNTTPNQNALLSSMVMVGMTVGACTFGWMADRFGRRTTLIFSATWNFYYACLASIVPDYTWMLVLRFLVGFGAAGCLFVVPYFAEFLPTEKRGKFSVLPMLFWASGGLLTVLSAMAFMRFSWRMWLLSVAGPALLFLLLSPVLPKSPRYELACGQKDQMWIILKYFAKKSGKTLPDVDIKEVVVKRRGRISDLFIPEFRFTTILMMIVWFIAGFSYYGVALFSTYLIQIGNTCTGGMVSTEDANCYLTRKPLVMDDYISLLWTTSAELPAVFMSMALIDTLGRKMALVINYTLAVLSLLLLNICMTKLPMVFLLFVLRGVTCSGLQILFPYTSELYPTEVRGLAIGCGSGISRFGAVITPFFAQVLFAESINLAFAVFAVIIIIQIVVILFIPHETLGKHMVETYAE